MLFVTMVSATRTMSIVWATTSIVVMTICQLVNLVLNSTAEAKCFPIASWATMALVVRAAMTIVMRVLIRVWVLIVVMFRLKLVDLVCNSTSKAN